jgi:REP element-mobilizing transposase RayT
MGETFKKTKDAISKNNFTITEIKSEKDHIQLPVNYPPIQSVTNVFAKHKQYSAFYIWHNPHCEIVYETIFGKVRRFWTFPAILLPRLDKKV